MWVGRLWQSMQSIRRVRLSWMSAAASGCSVLWYTVTSPSGRCERTHGMDCRAESVAMYVTLLLMFMCQWIPDVGPASLLPPPILTKRSSVHFVLFTSDVKYVLLTRFSLKNWRGQWHCSQVSCAGRRLWIGVLIGRGYLLNATA